MKDEAKKIQDYLDITVSSDPVWNDLVKKISELDEKRKEREKFLQNIPYESQFVDPETGVFLTRPPKTSKTKVKCQL